MTLTKRYVAVSRNKIAAALVAQNDLRAALAQITKALNINRELSRDDSINLILHRELTISLKGAGDTTDLIYAARQRKIRKYCA